MNKAIYLQTKFLVPRQTTDFLPRPRLAKWLKANLDKRLLMVSAPAGYGKTTFLASLIHAGQLQSAWYQLNIADNDPSIFLGYLVQSLAQKYSVKAPGLGAASMALLDSSDETQPEYHRILMVLINELFDLPTGNWSIVLEDYHLINNPSIHEMIDYLLDNAPPGFQLVLSTRIDPPLQLGRLRARDQMAELQAMDLRFTAEETRNWVKRLAPGLTPGGIETLTTKTEGWAAALQIILSSIKNQEHVSAELFIENISGTHRYFFEYLANEVFRRLAEDQQNFLLQTAVLEEMDLDASNAMTSNANAALMFQSLEASNLVSTSVSADRQWFRYHQLFREFLLGRLRRDDRESYLQMQHKAGRYFEAAKSWDTAFKHYVASGDQKDASRMLEKFAPEFVEHGRLEALNRYIGQLDSEIISSAPELLLQQGNVLRRLGQAGAALSRYEEARVVFKRYGDHAGVCRALTELANVNYLQGFYRKAYEIAAEALTQATVHDHAERARALMTLAKSEGFLTGMDTGRRKAEQAIDEANLAGDAVSTDFRANLLQGLGQICWWHGDPQATVRYCEEAMRVLPNRLSPIAAKAYISMVTPHLYWRDFDKALEYAESGLEIAQTLQMNELLPSAYAALGNVLTRLGETARAENALRQAMETAHSLGLASYERLMATGYLAYNLAGQGRYDEAHQLAEGALWSYTGNPDTYEVYVCRSVLADIALEKKDLDNAEQLFLDLVNTGQEHEFRIPLALVYFGLAYIYLTTSRKEKGLEYAIKSFELIEPTRAIQLYIDQGARSYLVCKALLDSGVTDPFIQRVLEHIDQAVTEGPDFAVVDNKAVVVKTFGHFRVLINDVEITSERWGSTKARDLLAYFVTYRKERHSADRAFTALWQDHRGSGRTAFHTALSRLRKALRGKEQTLKYILLEKGDYWLDDARFAFDVDQFDFAVKKSHTSRGSSETIAWIEHALNLYSGEYLGNLYYDWVFPERRRLQQLNLKLLCRLAELRAASGAHENAIELLTRALEEEPLMEEIHCQMMESYAALNNHAAVARQYRELQELLEAELSLSPSPETKQRYQAIMKMSGS